MNVGDLEECSRVSSTRLRRLYSTGKVGRRCGAGQLRFSLTKCGNHTHTIRWVDPGGSRHGLVVGCHCTEKSTGRLAECYA